MNAPYPPPNPDAGDAVYASLLECFANTGFGLEAICRRLRISNLAEVDPLRVRHLDFGPVENGSDLLIALFVEGKPLASETLGQFLPGETRAVLDELGLLTTVSDGKVAASVALYPIEHLYIASDRYNSPEMTEFQGFKEIVYPCLFETSRRFQRTLPRRRVGTVLDLCSGTAFAALLLARDAGHVYAADITERCAQYARFNARLNDIRNATILTGDLYEPAQGRQFDLIVVHPPYQPVFRQQQIFNSGGIDGEQITRRCVEQALQHLNPGGRLYCLAQITARQDPVHVRVRAWIEEHCGAELASQCDAGFYITKRHDLELFAAKATLTTKGTNLDFLEWRRQFAKMGVRSLDYGLLIVERHGTEAPREPFTAGWKACEQWDPADFEASFAFEVDRRSPGFAARMWGSRMKANSSCKLEVTHTLRGGSWHVEEYKICQEAPFDVKIHASQGVAHLMSVMDGYRTLEGCRQTLIEAGAELSREQFLQTAVSLASEGFLVPERPAAG